MNPWVFAVGFLLVAVVLYDPIRRTARAVVGWGMNSSISSRPRVLRELTAELAASLDQAAIETCVLGMSERLGLSRIRIFVGEEDGWHEVGGSRHLGKDYPLVK